MANALALAIQTLTLQASCAHCGQQGRDLKRCPVCRQAWYCGADCQKSGWKKHKKKCAPPLCLVEVWEKVCAACAALEWQGVLKWQGRMEELMTGKSDESCNEALINFQIGHRLALDSTGNTAHSLSIIALEERRVKLLGKMQRFRDQGGEMCALADSLHGAGRKQEAGVWYHKARDVGAAHGFFSVECEACYGLGNLAMAEGRDVEGLDLLRNALAASSLSEDEEQQWEFPVMQSLIGGLFKMDALEEVEPLIQRYREAAKAKSSLPHELSCLYFKARLHEVPCIWHPRWTPSH